MAGPIYNLELLQAARDGNKEAIVSLLVLAEPDIRRYASRACQTSSDVEDAAQEALWLLYRKVGTLRAITSFSGWLFSIVRRECWRLAQRVLGKQVAIEDMQNTREFSMRPQTELRIDLARAIESLPEHYREIVLLRDIEELTINEIAETVGRTREAVKANLHRSRRLLREYLT